MSAITKKSGNAEFVKSTTFIPDESHTHTVRASVMNVFPASPADAAPNQTLKLVEQSGVLDFWLDKEEDIYGHDDGEPI